MRGYNQVVRQILDLLIYLDGLPADLRFGSYGDSYRARISQLLDGLN